jgi:pentatricopeptide repeat protein
MNHVRRLFCKALQVHIFASPVPKPDARKAFEQVDTSLDVFFKERELSTDSFNFLMQVHIDRRQYQQAL